MLRNMWQNTGRNDVTHTRFKEVNNIIISILFQYRPSNTHIDLLHGYWGYFIAIGEVQMAVKYTDFL